MANAVQKRKDPSHRPVDGSRSAEIQNGHPDRVYVLVRKNSEIGGPEEYEDMGYEYVRPADGDKERIRGRKNRGESSNTIETQGHVLMWISRQEHARIQREGPYGDSGQKFADRIDNKILDKKSMAKDAFRGLNGMHGMALDKWDGKTPLGEEGAVTGVGAFDE